MNHFLSVMLLVLKRVPLITIAEFKFSFVLCVQQVSESGPCGGQSACHIAMSNDDGT
jgi:hypothetical protein